MKSMEKHRLMLTVCAIALSFVAAGKLSAATSSAVATIDWATLEINVVGDGGLVPLDDTVVVNSAWVADAHGTGVSGSGQVFGPAFAAHPFHEDNGAIATFDGEASTAIAGADFGSAVAESGASTNLLAVGWGTALLSVAYTLAAEIDKFGIDSAVAAATAALGVTRVDPDTGTEAVVFFDEASALRADGAGSIADTGYLTAWFEFADTDGVLFRLDGATSAHAVGALAAPIPGALPLMLGALGIAGTVSRRKRAA